MGEIAFLFSGQGAQYPGMGRDLYEKSPAARAVFDMADRLRPGTSGQCFSGTKEELSLTINTQPCLFAVDLAAAEALREAGVVCSAAAGFSLGELAALAFSGALSFEAAFELVCKRAELMQGAAEENPSMMAAVLRLPAERVIEICEDMEGAYPANFNCPGQTVVAFSKTAESGLKAKVKAQKGAFIPLAVSGGFHSPFMARAAQGFKGLVEGLDFGRPKMPLYSNLTARPYEDNLAEGLARQIESPVLWQDTIERMLESDIDIFIEAGAGATLTGLVRKIAPEAAALNVEDGAGLEKTLEELDKLC